MTGTASGRCEADAEDGVNEEDIVDQESWQDAENEGVGDQVDILCFTQQQYSKSLANKKSCC